MRCKIKKIWIFVVLALFLVLLLPKKNATDMCLDDVYRINGSNYYLVSRGYFSQNQLWIWDGAYEKLFHRFSIWTQGSPYWSNAHDAFFYMKHGHVYRWDYQSHKETHLYKMKKHSLQAVLQDYLVFKDEQNNIIISELSTGNVIEKLHMSDAPVSVLDVHGNLMLLAQNDSVSSGRLYLYDATSSVLSLVEDNRGNLAAGLLTDDSIYFSITQGATYKSNYVGDKIIDLAIGTGSNTVVAFEKSDKYVVCAKREFSSIVEHGPYSLIFYLISSDNTISKIGSYGPVNDLIVNGCRIACEDDVVITGFVTERDKAIFYIK